MPPFFCTFFLVLVTTGAQVEQGAPPVHIRIRSVSRFSNGRESWFFVRESEKSCLQRIMGGRSSSFGGAERRSRDGIMCQHAAGEWRLTGP